MCIYLNKIVVTLSIEFSILIAAYIHISISKHFFSMTALDSLDEMASEILFL